MIKMLKQAMNTLLRIPEPELLKKLKYLIEEEFIYVYPEYSLELLEEKTGFDQASINAMLFRIYKKSFYPLKRFLRVEFLRETLKEEPDLSLKECMYYAGYENLDLMLLDIKFETGLDFEGFCRYVRDIGQEPRFE
jgi:hypothetical protein